MAMTDTRNQAWANDKSKFGYKMLEKMGWTEGKGLGVKEDGMTSHIRMRRRTTNAGVGGENNLDAWNKPAEMVAGLSAVLTRIAPVNSEKAAVEAQKVSEKGRGYYQRRSAGKNVSAYSETDLKEIFGGIQVDHKPEERETGLGHGNGQKRSQDRDNLVAEENVGTVKTTTEKCNGGSATSSQKRTEKEKRKRLRKEKGEKAKTKSLSVEVAIKKSKKSKKGKRREAR